jgi:hypothetical protein
MLTVMWPMPAGFTRLIRSLALMTLIKNLRCHSLPPLNGISSRDKKVQNKVGRWFSEREITHRVKLVWLPSQDRLLAVITFSCSEVLNLLLGVRAITYEMPGLSTIVAKEGGSSLGLETCC